MSRTSTKDSSLKALLFLKSERTGVEADPGKAAMVGRKVVRRKKQRALQKLVRPCSPWAISAAQLSHCKGNHHLGSIQNTGLSSTTKLQENLQIRLRPPANGAKSSLNISSTLLISCDKTFILTSSTSHSDSTTSSTRTLHLPSALLRLPLCPLCPKRSKGS